MITAENPFTERLSGSATSKDGELTIIIGKKGKGKTSFALDILPKNYVIICPGSTNPEIRAHRYVWNDHKGLKFAVENRNRVVYTRYLNLALFDYLTGEGLVLLLDDMRMMLNHRILRGAFEEWARGIRWRHQRVIITTHRPVADMKPVIYDLSDYLYWVGPLRDEEEIENLRTHNELDLSQDQFQWKCKSLVPYDYATKNWKESLFQIKVV